MILSPYNSVNKIKISGQIKCDILNGGSLRFGKISSKLLSFWTKNPNNKPSAVRFTRLSVVL